MGDFFHGWRRKTGSMLLVMALVLMGTWGRSYLHGSRFDVEYHDEVYVVESINGSVRWAQWVDGPFGGFIVNWDSDTLGEIPYWSIILPVTLLSACLILWKPRKRHRHNIVPATTDAVDQEHRRHGDDS